MNLTLPDQIRSITVTIGMNINCEARLYYNRDARHPRKWIERLITFNSVRVPVEIGCFGKKFVSVNGHIFFTEASLSE